MTIKEIKKTIIELSEEEKEILKEAGKVLYELYEADDANNILYDILDETKHDLADLDDISFVLNCICEKNLFVPAKAD